MRKWASGKESYQKWRERRTWGQKAADGAPDTGLLEGVVGDKVEGGHDRGRDGWAAFPGLSSYLSRCENVYSQRLPLGQGWPVLTGNKPRPMSQSFSWGGSHPSLGLPPSHSPSYLHLPTPRHTASSVTVRYACAGRPGSSWPCENGRRYLPSLHSLLKLGWRNTVLLTLSLCLSHNTIWIAVVFDRLWYLSTFSTNSRSFVSNLTPGCCIAHLKMAETL